MPLREHTLQGSGAVPGWAPLSGTDGGPLGVGRAVVGNGRLRQSGLRPFTTSSLPVQPQPLCLMLLELLFALPQPFILDAKTK